MVPKELLGMCLWEVRPKKEDDEMTEQSLPFESRVDMRDSQSRKILDYLLAGHRLTPLDALLMFNCMRLGARKFDLVRAGWNVQTEMVQDKGKRFAQYWIPADRQRI